MNGAGCRNWRLLPSACRRWIPWFALFLIAVLSPGCTNRPAPQSPVVSRGAQTAPAGWFEDHATSMGVAFSLGTTGPSPHTLLGTIGSGCAAVDFDGDGKVDLFFAAPYDTQRKGVCALYRNNGNGTFADVTAGSGLETPGNFMGCAVADLDNDGRPDLIVVGYGIVRVFRNLGHLKFRDVTAGSGLEAPSAISWATSIACGDFDRDGRVDLYIGRYVKFDRSKTQLCDYGANKSSCGPNFYDAQIGSLYRNLGNFHFKDVTREYGLDQAHGKCLGAAFCDVDGDGWPDLYLANDEMPGDLFLNQKGRHFQNVALERGVALSGDGTFQGGMGVDFGDYNRDGRMDLFVTTFELEPDALYGSSASGVFTFDARRMGLEQATRNLVGFGTKFGDFNNDGFLDLAIVNGHTRDNNERVDTMGHYAQPAQLFMYENGAYADRSREGGAGFTTPAVGRGLALADIDNDGRLDLVIVDLEGRARILMNRMPNTGAWLTVRLRATHSNRMALGSRVTVRAGGQSWIAEATTGGSYLSASDPRVHFGLGTAASIDSVEVRWPSGAVSRLQNPPISREIEIKEP